MRTPFAALFAVLCLVHAAPAADTSALVKQAARLEKEGNDPLAAELLRTALQMNPKDADTHRLLGENLQRQNKCADAIPEFRFFLEQAPPKLRKGKAWDGTATNLALCMRAQVSRLELRVAEEARCATNGAPVVARAGAPALFELTPGSVTASCQASDGVAWTGTYLVAAGETRGVDVAFARAPPPPPEAILRVTSGMPAMCALDASRILAVQDAPIEVSIAVGKHRVECTSPGLPAFDKDLVVVTGGTLLELPYKKPEPPPPMPDFPLPGDTDARDFPDPAMPTAKKPKKVPAFGELEVNVDGPGWKCSLDGGEPAPPNATGQLFAQVSVGDHTVDCKLAGAAPFQRTVTIKPGAREVLDVKFERTPRSIDAPPGPPPAAPDAMEWSVIGGVGPALGTVGLALGMRYGAWGASVGTGLYPLSVSVLRYGEPGAASSTYLTAGYVRVSPGLLFGGSAVSGHGVFAGVGVELRRSANVAYRVGLGLGVNTTGTQTGPFTLDLSAAFLP